MRRRDLYLMTAALLLLAGCGRYREEHSARLSRAPVQTPSPPPLPLVLIAGERLVQSLPPGQARRYEVALRPGQYLQVVLQQEGVDVAAQVFDPEGHLLLQVDSPTDMQGPEEVFLVAGTAGRHVLEVEASKGDGHYEVRVEALRPATVADKKRAAAAAAYSRARLADREPQGGPPAVAPYREAAKLWRAAGDETREAWSLFWLGKRAAAAGDPTRWREGVEALDRALDLYRRAGDRRQQALSLDSLGLAWKKLGDMERSGRGYEQALALWRELGKPSEEAECLNNLALDRLLQGHLQAPLDLYSQAIEVWQRLGDRSDDEAITRTNLGVVYAQLGEGRLALDQYHRALALLAGKVKLASLKQRAVTLNKLGDVLLWMEGPEAALAPLREALKLRRQGQDTSGQAVTQNSIGLAQWKANRPREALEAFRVAEAIFRQLKDRPAQAVTLTNLGNVYERLGLFDRARESYERGLRTAAAAEMPAIAGLARVAREEDHLDEAERYLERLLALVDRDRSQVARPDLRASYQATWQKQYAFLLDLLAERHRREPGRGYAARAFAVSERARARSLLDLLGAARSQPGPEELHRLDDLSRQINARHLDLLTSPQGVANGEQEEKLSGLLESWHQESAAAEGPPQAVMPSLSLAEAERLLDPDTLLLEYFLGEERSYLWAVTSETSRFVDTLPGREAIETAARQAHQRLTESHRQTGEVGARQAAERLSLMLLGPVADLLPGRRRLVVVPHGALQAVPFAALPSPPGTDRTGDPLIAEHQVVSLPSVSVLAALRSALAGRRKAEGFLAVVADPVLAPDDPRLRRSRAVAAASVRPLALPRLPFTSREALDILGFAGSRRVLAASGFAANRKLVQSGGLKDYQILHFATHSLLDDLHPELSALTLSTFDEAGRPIDGELRAYEISDLTLRADLVVLSACRTAMGREIGGEGRVGLTQAFLHAGAPRLLASLWDVDDRSTGELMKRFYAGLLRGNLPPAEALRQAQISLFKDPRWRAPYHWAGFVLQGEWR